MRSGLDKDRSFESGFFDFHWTDRYSSDGEVGRLGSLAHRGMLAEQG